MVERDDCKPRVKNPHLSHLFFTLKIDLYEFV